MNWIEFGLWIGGISAFFLVVFYVFNKIINSGNVNKL